VTYLSVKRPEPPVVKYHAQKYKDFVEEAARIYPDRVLMPNDLNAYIEFMHTEKMDTNAMLLVMQYCKDLGGDKTGTRYVVAVAKAWAEKGYLTEKQVADHIADLENNNEEIRAVFNELGVKRSAGMEDRQAYYKWQEYGFTLDAVLTAARTRKKKGGMEKLDAYMEELKRAGAVTGAEILAYTENKEKIHTLTVDICKNLGVYYSTTENVVDVYVMPWLKQGFEEKALLRISEFCFLRNVHTLEVMRQMVEKMAQAGLYTFDEIERYVARQVEADEKIRAVYAACGYMGTITNRDRENYRTWLEWGYDERTILAVASRYNGTTFPMQSISRIMGSAHNCGIMQEEEVMRFADKSGGRAEQEEYQKHQYSEEELKSALVNFDNWE